MNNDELTLEILRKTESIDSQKGLADRLGYSVGKVNYVLKALVKKGLLKIENFSNAEDKKKYRYLLTEKGIKEKIALTEKFIERKKAEYEELKHELEGMRSQ